MTAHDRLQTLDAAEVISDSPQMKALIAAFDRVWDTRVVRARDVISIEDELKG